MVESRGVEL